jgi:hypothetical protein
MIKNLSSVFSSKMVFWNVTENILVQGKSFDNFGLFFDGSRH